MCLYQSGICIKRLTDLVIDTCGYTTAKQACFIQRSLWIDFDNASIINNCVLAKCGSGHEMVNGFSPNWEMHLSIISHHTPWGINFEIKLIAYTTHVGYSQQRQGSQGGLFGVTRLKEWQNPKVILSKNMKLEGK